MGLWNPMKEPIQFMFGCAKAPIGICSAVLWLPTNHYSSSTSMMKAMKLYHRRCVASLQLRRATVCRPPALLDEIQLAKQRRTAMLLNADGTRGGRDHHRH